jgi:hypothetical protein
MIQPLSIKRTTRSRRLENSDIVATTPGELLTMPDGSEWFHPYHGGKPQREKEPNS